MEPEGFDADAFASGGAMDWGGAEPTAAPPPIDASAPARPPAQAASPSAPAAAGGEQPAAKGTAAKAAAGKAPAPAARGGKTASGARTPLGPLAALVLGALAIAVVLVVCIRGKKS